MTRAALVVAATLALAACGSGDGDEEVRDESKLSAELEQRAHGIEARAQEGVAAAEREAAADLARLNQEAAASATAAGESAPDTSAIVPPLK
jgi:hypothetical protein